MQYIKENKKAKKGLLILREQIGSGDIIDIEMSNLENTKHYLDGNQVNPWQVVQKDKSRIVTNRRNLVDDLNYEVVRPFVFKADFSVGGSSSTSSYTDTIKLQEFDEPRDDWFFSRIADFHGNTREPRYLEERFRYFNTMITPRNLCDFLKLACDDKHPDFSAEIKHSNISKEKRMVISGNWSVETNKNYLCVKPYVD